ncbi:MAG: Mini-ribonuclease 3 [Leptolyngbyaceae cyanobacterium CSU_1_4]|nr:Mini-ribonuclease 3 [Leptolyngbyaceae cyanobacterium CSU_1_4]
MEPSEEEILGFSPPHLLASLISFNREEIQSLGSSPRLNQVSPAALAYVGDAIYELYIRTHYLLPPKRLQVYHEQVVAQVRAESQAQHLQLLQPHLTHAELEILKRGRNAASRGPKRLNPEIYQQATSLETLLGYLYLTDPQRLMALLVQLQFEEPAKIKG